MKKLNDKHNYGCKLILVSVDEGITGYRDDSLEVRVFLHLFPIIEMIFGIPGLENVCQQCC